MGLGNAGFSIRVNTLPNAFTRDSSFIFLVQRPSNPSSRLKLPDALKYL
jgi:hypothetical protein